MIRIAARAAAVALALPLLTVGSGLALEHVHGAAHLVGQLHDLLRQLRESGRMPGRLVVQTRQPRLCLRQFRTQAFDVGTGLQFAQSRPRARA